MSAKLKPQYADPKSVIVEDFRGHGILAAGTTVPTDGEAGYATGCIFCDVDAAAGSQFFINTGTSTSCNFDALASNTIANALATQSAYTQTYSTADKTVAAPTASTLTDNSGGAAADGTIGVVTAPTALTVTDGTGTNDGTIGAITGDASVIAAVQELAAFCNAARTAIVALTDAVKELSTAVNANIADDLDNRKTITAIIDDLQALTLVG